MDFWHFAGSYWWLVFPLMGVFGAIGNQYERNARRRHQRRLETLHAKAEVRAARRGQVLPPYAAGAGAAPSAAAPEVPQKVQLQRLMDAHDAVTHRWLDYELDVSKLIEYPAMSDGRQPLTAAFLRARTIADRARPASADAAVSAEDFAAYRAAVTDYEVAFDVAERDARRLKDTGFTDDERKRLDTAKQLLGVAVDQAATPAERQLAYKRVRRELDGLIALSDDAIEVLETKVSLELPAGASSGAGATGGDAGAGASGAAKEPETKTPGR
ncbi:MAG TPA: hypothetical protein VJR25_14970 [Microbacterium sp.]|uniref:hypothetical protein n=1 Tax=Microbacterium sp. TaxID=51671 RepID=UPI002B4622E3|nr:hypothetical protein [Microbacterium sp.]HKT58062.1 hypothetical protein [Microbacterium sp.]